MYSRDNYSIQSYGAMVDDNARTQPFVDALTRLITPETVVLDIGTGTGFFALLAAKLGAARVYAIEPDDAIQVGKLCARDVPNGERITWLQGLSTELDLPEQADIVIGDLHGTMPFYNGMIASLADARRRHLKPGGTMLPSRDVLRVVPAQAPHEYSSLERPWRDNGSGLDLKAGRAFVANSWWRVRSEPARTQDLLSTPATWGEVDYMSTESTELDGNMQFTIERAGTLHGYYVWFDGQIADGLGYSNAPNLPELVYGRAFFPLEQPIDVQTGDQVALRMSTKLIDHSHIYRWDSEISDADGTSKGKFRQTTFRSRPIAPKDLRLAAADHRPVLNPDGQVDHAVMQAMARSESLGQIAQELTVRFPDRFSTQIKALAHVAKLSQQYSTADKSDAIA